MRQLGETGISVSSLCFGGNVFGWTVNESTAFDLLDAFTQAGCNFIDTADTYSIWAAGNKGGESETIIGNWMYQRKNRQQVVIATKVGWEMSADKKGLKKAYILQEVEESLKRLQTDYIDLYQAHKDDPGTPLEETLEAFSILIQQGKVRAIGASNYSAQRLQAALNISKQNNLARFQTLQPLYNLYDREEFETNLMPLCTKEKLAVIPYYSLAKGFLSGKYRSEADLNKSPRGSGAKNYLTAKGMKILEALDVVASKYKTTPTVVALAWLKSRPTIVAPIASATNLHQLQDLLAATKLELDADSISMLEIN